MKDYTSNRVQCVMFTFPDTWQWMKLLQLLDLKFSNYSNWENEGERNERTKKEERNERTKGEERNERTKGGEGEKRDGRDIRISDMESGHFMVITKWSSLFKSKPDAQSHACVPVADGTKEGGRRKKEEEERRSGRYFLTTCFKWLIIKSWMSSFLFLSLFLSSLSLSLSVSSFFFHSFFCYLTRRKEWTKNGEWCLNCV